MILCSSCASERTIVSHKSSEEEAFNERFFGGFTMVKDKDGTVSTTATKRSSFEKGEEISRGTDLDKESYLTKKYDKSSYDGASKPYETTTWDGKRSYAGAVETPDFMKKQSNISTQRWEGKNKSYAVAKTNDQERHYQDQNKILATDSNEQVNEARKTYVQPEYMNSRSYMKKTLEQTKEMLGRHKLTEKDI